MDIESTIKLNDLSPSESLALFGVYDSYLHILQQELKVELSVRGDMLHVIGTEKQIKVVEDVLKILLNEIRNHKKLDERDVYYATTLVDQKSREEYVNLKNVPVGTTVNGKLIYAKTLGQKEFITAMRSQDVLFAIGPAGTGKTYLAVVYATTLLKNNEIKKIILTRPAVEAGESLGFLPGDLKEKVDPYLTPLYDALHDTLGVEQTERYIEKGIIEIAPLAYMRGRTLNDALIILDEAQNTTVSQIKMFLTRLGFRSRMIITGDVTQIDLPKSVKSGLNIAKHVLKHIKGISFIELTSKDVVRHPLVLKMIEAFAENENESTNR